LLTGTQLEFVGCRTPLFRTSSRSESGPVSKLLMHYPHPTRTMSPLYDIASDLQMSPSVGRRSIDISVATLQALREASHIPYMKEIASVSLRIVEVCRIPNLLHCMRVYFIHNNHQKANSSTARCLGMVERVNGLFQTLTAAHPTNSGMFPQGLVDGLQKLTQYVCPMTRTQGQSRPIYSGHYKTSTHSCRQEKRPGSLSVFSCSMKCLPGFKSARRSCSK
jgi:hypothetical protein